MLYWVWNAKITFCDGEEATKLSLKYLFENGSNINTIFSTKYVKNQTLFNMIIQNTDMHPQHSLQLLIEYQFDFENLVNVYDNVKHTNGLIQLCKYSPNYQSVKMLFDHCSTLKKCKIDITHCDTTRRNALFYAAIYDNNTFKCLVSDKCFPNHDEMDDNNVQIALNQKDIGGNTVAHDVAANPSPHIVDTFKVLHKCNFNFNIYCNRGILSIHEACINNHVSLLSWMIDENIFDINCQTRARNKQWNDRTPLFYAIDCNNIECVDVLCKQIEDIVITKRDVYLALNKDNVSILKLLLCGLFKQCVISSMNDILKQQSNVSSIISSNSIESMIEYCNDHISEKCRLFLNELFVKGYSCNDFNFIVLKLDYDLKTVINDDNKISNADDNKILAEYEIEKNLGKGTFGLVQVGINKKDGNKVAIKHIILNNKTPIQFITSEIESLKKLSTHNNIINLLNYQIFKTKVLLYFEYCLFGDLYSLLNQLDHFSMRISFKYFTQILDAISTCHKMNIVHRDLKLQNILISDTFQLKVADFGLASIVDNKNYDTIYNVGTPMYKSPELLENTNYDIRNIIVLKSCDVFSLSIIFWQMMNGIEYLPFKCYKNNGINNGNYSLIKNKTFDKFWKLHGKCNMMISSGKDIELLCNLFEQMFEYNPHERITIESIIKHQYISVNDSNVLFHMNDSQLEAFVRDKYHQTKNSKNKKHIQAPQTYYNSNYVASGITSNNSSNVSDEKTSGFDGSQFLNQDSSRAQINANESKVYLDQNKIIYSFNPLVVIIGIESNIENDENDNIIRDYVNVKQMLHGIKQFDIIYHDTKHDIVHLRKGRGSSITSNEFGLEWSVKDLDNFHNEIFDIVQNVQFNYDCLIYFASCGSAHSKEYLHDSYKKKYSLKEKIFDTFNNRKCSQLAKKAKIFIIQSYNDGNDNSIDYKHVEHTNVDFVDQYKRIIYANNNGNVNDGSALISSFCVSLCKNQNDNIDENNIQDIKDLNDIIDETESRMNNKFFDDNYIPSRCKIVFTSFEPLRSAIHYDPIHITSSNGNNTKNSIKASSNNDSILETIGESKQDDSNNYKSVTQSDE